MRSFFFKLSCFSFCEVDLWLSEEPPLRRDFPISIFKRERRRPDVSAQPDSAHPTNDLSDIEFFRDELTVRIMGDGAIVACRKPDIS